MVQLHRAASVTVESNTDQTNRIQHVHHWAVDVLVFKGLSGALCSMFLSWFHPSSYILYMFDTWLVSNSAHSTQSWKTTFPLFLYEKEIIGSQLTMWNCNIPLVLSRTILLVSISPVFIRPINAALLHCIGVKGQTWCAESMFNSRVPEASVRFKPVTSPEPKNFILNFLLF